MLYFKIYIEIKCIGAISQIRRITLGDILLLISLKIILSFFRIYNIDVCLMDGKKAYRGKYLATWSIFPNFSDSTYKWRNLRRKLKQFFFVIFFLASDVGKAVEVCTRVGQLKLQLSGKRTEKGSPREPESTGEIAEGSGKPTHKVIYKNPGLLSQSCTYMILILVSKLSLWELNRKPPWPIRVTEWIDLHWGNSTAQDLTDLTLKSQSY